MSEPIKSYKKLKIRKKKPSLPSPTSDSTKQKSLKIAKKIVSPISGLPVYSSIQEDFIFENEQDPLHFLSTNPSNLKYEIISNSTCTSPNLIQRPNKTQGFKFRNISRKRSTKYHLNFSNTTKYPSKPLEQQLLERSKQFKQSMDSFHPKPEKFLEKSLMKQTKSLESFKRVSEYWEKLEQNIADVLETNPEDLRLASGRRFMKQQSEKEEIENFDVIKETSQFNFWKESLRADTERKNLKSASPDTTPVNKKSLVRSAKLQKSLSSPTKNPLNNLKKVPKSSQQIPNTTTELLIKGFSKMKVEYEVANRVGKQFVLLPPLEPYTEELITKNYESKLLY